MSFRAKCWINAEWLALESLSDNVVLSHYSRAKFQLFFFFLQLFIFIEQQSLKLSALWRHTKSRFHYSCGWKAIWDRFSQVPACLQQPEFVVFVGKQDSDGKSIWGKAPQNCWMWMIFLSDSKGIYRWKVRRMHYFWGQLWCLSSDMIRNRRFRL